VLLIRDYLYDKKPVSLMETGFFVAKSQRERRRGYYISIAGRARNTVWIGRFFILAALKPSANLGTRVGGGASGATSQLTNNVIYKVRRLNCGKNNY
jgi:hypothetical protein